MATGNEAQDWARARQDFLADERDRLADERDRLDNDRDARAHQLRANARVARDDERRRRDATPTVLARYFAAIAARLFAGDTIEQILVQISGAAVELVDGATSCSVSFVEKIGGPRTAASCGPGAVEADEQQYRVDEGPCLSAARDREANVYTPDVSSDDRWPRLSASYLSPLQTVASYGLHQAWTAPSDDGDPEASLNIYGTGVDAIGHEARDLGLVLAAHASMAVRVAEERAAARKTESGLQTALLSRDVIGQDKGILMERSKLSADEAFDVLRQVSQTYNRKLRDVAEWLALTGEVPTPPPA